MRKIHLVLIFLVLVSAMMNGCGKKDESSGGNSQLPTNFGTDAT